MGCELVQLLEVVSPENITIIEAANQKVLKQSTSKSQTKSIINVERVSIDHTDLSSPPGRKRDMEASSEKKRRAETTICGGCGGAFAQMSKHHHKRPRCLKKIIQMVKEEDGEKERTPTASTDEAVTFKADIKATVARDLADFRLGRNSLSVSGTAVDGFKACVASWLASVEASLVSALRPYHSTASGVEVAELLRSRLDIFNGINTAKLEQAELIRGSLGSRWVAPQRRMMPGSESDCVWDIPLISQLQALITYDRSAAAQILGSSEQWSSDAAGTTSTTRSWSDITDGDVFKKHPKLGTASGAAPCKHSVSGVKTAWKIYYDDVEVANPLGVARGIHSIGAIYVSLINLDPATRNRLEYTFVVTLALTSVIKKYGMLGVLAGAHLDGSLDSRADSSLGAQMRALNAGVMLSYPVNGAFGGVAKRTTYGWALMACADFPAAAKMVGTAGSTSAMLPCRLCNWERESSAAWAASSFLERSKTRRRWKLRDLRSTDAALAQVELQRSAADKAATMRGSGLYAKHYAFHPTYFPHLLDPFASSPQDGMHLLFSSGLVTSTAAEMLYIFISIHKDFTVDQINQRIDQYDWPQGATIVLTVLRMCYSYSYSSIPIHTHTYTHTLIPQYLSHVYLYTCTCMYLYVMV
jgi:hypothetical protein